MSKHFIENNFNEIVARNSKIESRFIKTNIFAANLIRENKKYITGFYKANEYVVLIDNDYKKLLR